MIEILNYIKYSVFLYFGLKFIFKLMSIIIDKIYDDIKNWDYLTHININNAQQEENYIRIFTLKSKDYKLNLRYLNKSLLKCKRYYLENELVKLNYSKFDILKINQANCNIISNILRNNDEECIIIQNMNKPRDYFELVASLLVNDKKAIISILEMEDSQNFFQEDFTIENILKSGSHIFYDKGDRNLKLESRITYHFCEKILVGTIESYSQMKFRKEVKNDYFHIKIYEIEDGKYGISILKNNLNLDEISLYYIGQFYQL